jgi:hypothetical protein
MFMVGETMANIEIRGYAGELIRSFADWERCAMPPERKVKHWKKGRSAYELGWAWTGTGEPAIPADLAALLDSHRGTQGITIRSGIAERETPLPFGTRGPRCHDLALLGERDDSAVVICVEAKADESFGGTVTEELLKARTRSARTRFPDRLDWLTRSLLGVAAFSDPDRMVLSDVIAGLAYQLLAGVSGTLLEAELRGASIAIFVVHEFRTTATDDAKMEANGRALNDFLRLLLSSNGVNDVPMGLAIGQLVGPVPIAERVVDGPCKMPGRIPLYVGKIRTDRLIR